MTYLNLPNQYFVDAEGRLHPMTWGDVILEVWGKGMCAIGFAYFIWMVIS